MTKELDTRNSFTTTRHDVPIGRRAALAMLLAGTALPVTALRGAAQQRPLSIPSVTSAPEVHRVPFSEPPVIEAKDGVLEATLDITLRELWSHGEWLQYRNYNDGFVGPTLRVAPGDRMNVRLKNNLPKDDHGTHTSLHGMTSPHGPNVTNLHTHGLWISPTKPSDDVTLSIEPQGHYDYQFDIEKNHVSGTFWYHPHKHGSVESQVKQGMAGAIIVTGGIDELDGIKDAEDRLLVIQQIQPEPSPEEAAAINTVQDIAGPPNKTTTINALHAPTIKLSKKGLERWRLVAANAHDFLHIRLRQADTGREEDMHVIAYDGIPVHHVKAKTEISMVPGNRVDVLVRPTEPAIYEIWKRADPGQFEELPDDELIGFLDARDIAQDRAKIPTTIDKKLSHPDILKEDTSKDIRKVVFSVDRTDPENPIFLIDDKVYDEGVINQLLKLGDVEEWHILNTNPFMHPFHIHVNPFQIVETSDGSVAPGTWLDTVRLPPGTEDKPGFVKMRTRYQKFTGEFVLHCHILAHEDLGMMQNVKIS